MKIASIQVGQPREVSWKGKTYETAIFKHPVEGPVKALGFNLEGDKQADLTVHGGKDKAVYAYALEHYDYWKELRPQDDLVQGVFGENLTISGGLMETDIYIGDVYEVGTVQLRVAQPRLPCFKLGIRFGDDDVIPQFLKSERPGVYFQIAKEGTLNSGDSMKLMHREQSFLNVLQAGQLYMGQLQDRELMARALTIEGLANSLRKRFSKALG